MRWEILCLNAAGERAVGRVDISKKIIVNVECDNFGGHRAGTVER